MNLICITESELAQWVSRRYFDGLSARVVTGCEAVTSEIFSTSPYLKLEDSRGRIVVNLKSDWLALSTRVCIAQGVEVLSIPIEAIAEIAPTMEQYSKRLASYQLPIAAWSAEQAWDKWLVDQAVMEVHRAIVNVTQKTGCFDRELLGNSDLLDAIIRKTFRPASVVDQDQLLRGWSSVFEQRDSLMQLLRYDGHLDSTSMLKASAEKICSTLHGQTIKLDFDLAEEERGWLLNDVSSEILSELSDIDVQNFHTHNSSFPPLFCVSTYLRGYDEIHFGNKDWRTVFNLFRLAKFSVSSEHADILLVSLLASLKAEDIYSSDFSRIYSS
jgi:hypothetical protein